MVMRDRAPLVAGLNDPFTAQVCGQARTRLGRKPGRGTAINPDQETPMNPPPVMAVYTTLPDREHAKRMAQGLVQTRLAACVQLSDIESIYRWQGAIDEAREVRLLAKIAADRYAEVESYIRQHHPYAVPAIHALAFAQVLPAYASWVHLEAGATGQTGLTCT